MTPILILMMLTSADTDYFDEWTNENPRGCETLDNDIHDYNDPKIIPFFPYEVDPAFDGELGVLHMTKKNDAQV